jgi:5,6,7,8-tetrahydromethanopterin hydro-lyase
MPKVTKVCVGEALVGDGDEVAHIDLIIGPRGSPAEAAFCRALVSQREGVNGLLAVLAPNLPCKPNTVLFNKVTIRDAKQAVQMFGPAQRGVAQAVADSVKDGTIPVEEADDLFASVGVFIHWEAKDDRKIQDFNYEATRQAIRRAVNGQPSATEVLGEKDRVKHPFAAAEPEPAAAKPVASVQRAGSVPQSPPTGRQTTPPPPSSARPSHGGSPPVLERFKQLISNLFGSSRS